ncbi:MAG: tRNA threonylcarbamoyladenosine dehydratase [Deltaproteobacteria bacterium]|nr:tRNA threonylcarbamoyladenosine dehydratase [Deltaproteobacteria bacterium]
MSGERAALLLGEAGMQRLGEALVLVVGTGGVGSWVVEVLTRAGVGRLRLVDPDAVSLTDRNRQLPALNSTAGLPKVEVLADRCRDISGSVQVEAVVGRFDVDSLEALLGGPPDAVVDCIDRVSDKVLLLQTCVERGIPVFSAMGAGGRMDPTRVRLGALNHTRVDPLARVVRDALRERGVSADIPCVWSDEDPHGLHGDDLYGETGHLLVQGSVSWIPSLFGVKLGGLVVNRLLGQAVWGMDSEVGRHQERSGRTQQRTSPSVKPSRAHKAALLAQAGFARGPRED